MFSDVLLLVRLRKHRDALLDDPFQGDLGRRFPVLLANRRGEGAVHEFAGTARAAERGERLVVDPSVGWLLAGLRGERYV